MTDPKPRTAKTPRQRATEALAVEDRRVALLTADSDRHQKALDGARSALQAATTRRDYLASDPALGESTDTDTTDAKPTGYRDRVEGDAL